MKNLIAALSLCAALALPSAAQYTDIYQQDKVVDRSSGTWYAVLASSQHVTQVDTPQMAGSSLVVVKSTDATAAFCCSYQSTMSTSTTAGQTTCEMAEKEPGGNFYQLTFRRFAQNLSVYCLSMKTLSGSMLRVRQSR